MKFLRSQEHFLRESETRALLEKRLRAQAPAPGVAPVPVLPLLAIHGSDGVTIAPGSGAGGGGASPSPEELLLDARALMSDFSSVDGEARASEEGDHSGGARGISLCAGYGLLPWRLCVNLVLCEHLFPHPAQVFLAEGAWCCVMEREESTLRSAIANEMLGCPNWCDSTLHRIHLTAPSETSQTLIHSVNDSFICLLFRSEIHRERAREAAAQLASCLYAMHVAGVVHAVQTRGDATETPLIL